MTKRMELVPLGPEGQLVEEMRLRFSGQRCTNSYGCGKPAVGYFITLDKTFRDRLVQVSASKVVFNTAHGEIGYVKLGKKGYDHEVDAWCAECIFKATGERLGQTKEEKQRA